MIGLAVGREFFSCDAFIDCMQQITNSLRWVFLRAAELRGASGAWAVVGVAWDGIVVLERVGYGGFAGAVVVVGRGRVARRQPFHPLAQLGGDWVGLAGAH